MDINILKPLCAPHSLIEDKVSFSANSSELSIYSTYEASSQVRFQSDETSAASSLLICTVSV